MKQHDGIRCNKSRIFFLAFILVAPLQGYSQDFCSQTGLGLEQCEKVPCPSYFEPYLGAWHGTAVLAEYEQLGSLPRQLIFSKHACLKNSTTGKTYLIGKQTIAVPATEKLAARTLASLLVLERDSLAVVKSPADITRYTRREGTLADKKVIWQSDEAERRLVWTAAPTHDARSFVVTEPEKSEKGKAGRVIESGDESLLKRGQTSRFSGKMWVFTADGKLVGSSEILLKKIYNPKTGTLTEHTVSYERESKARTQQDVVLVYDVTSESLRASSSDRVSGAVVGKDRTINLYEVYRDGSLYSEFRVISKDGQVDSLIFQRADSLNENQYREIATQIQKLGPSPSGGRIPLK